MPNWCDNQITITGPNKIIDKIEKIVAEEGSEGNLLQYFHPMPKELNDTTSPAPNKTAKDKKLGKVRKLEFGADSWYDWRVNNWSTKWDVNEFYGIRRIELGIDESEISFGFDSAWAPPIGAYENFLNENSNVSIKASYYEGGCDFMGIWDNGDDVCYEISSIAPKGSTDKFWKTSEGKELDDLYGITESMAEYEAQEEANRIGDNKEIIDYSKGEKVNV
jgi:hypothetical protein